MSGNFRKEDLRVAKTYKSLISAIYSLLERRSFARITVKDLCEEAFISRATFYVHFYDKYDLLDHSLMEIKEWFSTVIIEEEKEVTTKINRLIYDNSKLIKNLIEDANSETLTLLNGFIASIIMPIVNVENNKQLSCEHIILSNFCSGGLINLLIWQMKNKFPPEIKPMNSYLYKMLKNIIEWDTAGA